jgi:hypothetical protein
MLPSAIPLLCTLLKVTLDFPRDFTMLDASAYSPRSEIVVKDTR